MAESVVSFAIERLGDLLISEIQFLNGVRDQVEEIQTELKRMQCFLRDADARQGESSRVRNWVAEIRELAFKTEDVIEIYAQEVATKKETTSSIFKEILRRLACIVREGVSLHKVGSEIESIKGKLTGLTTSLQTYGIKGLEEGESSNSTNMINQQFERISYSHKIEKDFVGMENEIEQLVSHLKNADRGCEVVSIWGMGGLGKTTLATKTFNHPEIRAYFQAFAWICVTQQFQREKVLQYILKELLPMSEEEISRMDDGKLVRELHKVQQEKTCLIVLDDIWTLAAWEKLMAAFPIGDTTGSKILLTTRIGRVAEVGFPYKIRSLSEEEGWQLLLMKVFPGRDNAAERKVNSKMEEVGKNMVRQCQGLPLAISTLGGILKGNPLKHWEVINKDIVSHIARGEGIEDDEYGRVRKILALSYDNLPHRLRHSFLYLGNYKEDADIWADDLYLLWMAEGIISLDDRLEGELMIDVAERYLGELEQRSLAQVEVKDEGESWLKFLVCHVHDLIRDLCLSKGKEGNFFKAIDFQRKHLNLHLTYGGDSARRLTIISSNDRYISSFLRLQKQHVNHLQLRTLLFLDGATERVWPFEISLHEFKLLRLLRLQDFDFSNGMSLPVIRGIGELVYLKYLSFIGCLLKELPSSIGNLRNLQTLDLRVKGEISIPNVLWKLKQLQHLYLPLKYHKISEALEKLSFDGLSELEVLFFFDAGVFDVSGLLTCRKLQIFSGISRSLDDLPGIINFVTSDLRHTSISIEDCDLSYHLILLLECPFLNDLWIGARVGVLPKKYNRHRFSQRLTAISLQGCEFEEDPMILLEILPNLKTLRLKRNSYLGKVMLCSATGFPQLRLLKVSALSNLAKWRVDEGAMPNLSRLRLSFCESLEMLPEGLRFITGLQKLEILRMSKAFKDRIRVIGGVEGEDFYKVRHVPSIFLDTDG